jgi:hypothetical protein
MAWCKNETLPPQTNAQPKYKRQTHSEKSVSVPFTPVHICKLNTPHKYIRPLDLTLNNPFLNGQSKANANSIAESPNRLLDLLKRRSSIGSPKEECIMFDVILRVEPATTHDERALFDASQKDFFLDLWNSLLWEARVFLVGDFHPMLTQFVSYILSKSGRKKGETYKHAGHGRFPAHDLLGKVFFASIENYIATSGVLETDVNQPVQVPAVSPMLI